MLNLQSKNYYTANYSHSTEPVPLSVGQKNNPTAGALPKQVAAEMSLKSLCSRPFCCEFSQAKGGLLAEVNFFTKIDQGPVFGQRTFVNRLAHQAAHPHVAVLPMGIAPPVEPPQSVFNDGAEFFPICSVRGAKVLIKNATYKCL